MLQGLPIASQAFSGCKDGVTIRRDSYYESYQRFMVSSYKAYHHVGYLFLSLVCNYYDDDTSHDEHITIILVYKENVKMWYAF